MNTITFTDPELETLKDIIRNVLSDPTLGSDSFEENLSNLMDKILWHDQA